MSASDIVTGFIEAIERKDIDAACALLHPEVSYENMPMNPISGRDATKATLEAFLAPADAVEWPVSFQIEDGRRVVNERIDRFRINNGWLELAVVGIFELDDGGLITLWRDYFDMGSYQRQMAELTAG